MEDLINEDKGIVPLCSYFWIVWNSARAMSFRALNGKAK